MILTFLNILLQSKSTEESIIVGVAVGVVTMIILLVFVAIKKAAKNIGAKSKEARRINKDSDQIE